MVILKVDRKGKKQSMRLCHFNEIILIVLCALMMFMYFGLGCSEIVT